MAIYALVFASIEPCMFNDLYDLVKHMTNHNINIIWVAVNLENLHKNLTVDNGSRHKPTELIIFINPIAF